MVLFNIKEFNNFEHSINSHSNSVDYMTAKGLTEKVDARLQKKEADKKFYIGMSYELVNNPEFNSQLFYPVETVEPVVR